MRLSFILIVLALVVSVSAQKKNTKVKPKPTPTKATVLPPVTSSNNQNLFKECFSSEALDIKAEKLVTDYHGQNLGNIIDELIRRKNITKDEFETTKQFEERLEKEKTKPLVGTLTSTSLFSFESNADFKYDADNQKMSVSFNFGKPVLWNVLCKDKISYIRLRQYSLTFVPADNRDKFWFSKFDIDIPKAKNVKPNLRILLIGTINSLGTRQYSFEPEELRFQLQEVWIYDVSTGELFSKNKTEVAKLSSRLLDSVTPLSAETEMLLQQARLFYKNGNDEEAMTILRKILGSEPTAAQAYEILGLIHLRRGDLEQAVSSLKTALFWNNTLIDAHIALSKISIQKGDCLQAKNYAMSAVQIDGGNQEVEALQKMIERCSPK